MKYVLKNNDGEIFSRFDPTLKPVFVSLEHTTNVCIFVNKEDLKQTKSDLQTKFGIETGYVEINI